MKDIKKEKNESIGLSGEYKIILARIENDYQKKIQDKIEKFIKAGISDWRVLELIRELNKVSKVRQYQSANIIPTVGRTMIADNLTNTSPDNTMRINYVALGDANDSSPTPSNSDTTLVNEVYRKVTASATNDDNVAYVTGFFTATEVADTFYEAGLFSDGTSTADSGVLFSHVALNSPSGIDKSNTETLTIDWVLTIN